MFTAIENWLFYKIEIFILSLKIKCAILRISSSVCCSIDAHQVIQHAVLA